MNEPKKYLQCPQCGNSPASEGVKFCYADGSRLVSKIATCSCGHPVDLRYDKFCEMCGKSTKEAKIETVEA